MGNPACDYKNPVTKTICNKRMTRQTSGRRTYWKCPKGHKKRVGSIFIR